MTFIQTIPKSRATGPAADAYRYLETVAPGRPPHVMEVFSSKPETMRAMVRAWELSMWMGHAPRRDREFLASVVSRLNNCTY